MIPVATFEGEQVAILGLGRSGLAAARAIKAGGGEPVCWDDNAASRAAAETDGLAVADLNREAVWDAHDFRVLILSPGIPHLYPEPNPVVRLAWKFNVPVDNDVSLFFDTIRNTALVQTVCITGSNGKSTTTALIHHILKEAGRNTQIGGNIGRGVLDLDPPRHGEIYVIELSSYQTDLACVLAPTIAVFLNLSPDHYDRHAGRGGYFAAKARLFEFGRPLHSVIGIDEDEGRYLAHHYLADREQGFGLGEEVTLVSLDPTAVRRGHLVTVKDGQLLDLVEGIYKNVVELSDKPSLLGSHNHQNACAAYAVCLELGLTRDQIDAGMKTFKGLPHRMEKVGRLGPILFVNDSKATNVDSAAKALASFDDIYWIAGGEAKEGGIDGLQSFFPKIRKSYLIGKAATEFAATLGERPHEIAGNMEKAIALAARDALAAGGPAVVLLSPACASFDQYRSFEHRGDNFRELVGRIKGIDKSGIA
jgi:UDP-N-acetylmuramoylalanine--D-glutamate ligase